jgi:hypothetical protein
MVEMSAEETIALARQKGLRTRPRSSALAENRAGGPRCPALVKPVA